MVFEDPGRVLDFEPLWRHTEDVSGGSQLPDRGLQFVAEGPSRSPERDPDGYQARCDDLLAILVPRCDQLHRGHRNSLGSCAHSGSSASSSPGVGQDTAVSKNLARAAFGTTMRPPIRTLGISPLRMAS